MLPQQQGDCSGLANTYWTGYRCACRVGFALNQGICAPAQLTDQVFRPAEFIYKISLLYQRPNPSQCTKPNEIFNGQLCECASGHFRNSLGICTPNGNGGGDNGQCPQNSVFVYGQCICNKGFEKRDNYCVAVCDENSYNNGLNQCVCRDGFVFQNGRCEPGIVCPPYSQPDSNRVCQCLSGYRKHDGVFCSMCPAGQISLGGQCVTTCGVNEVVNSAGKCECRPNTGKYNGVCSACPQNFFVFNGYCVTCPLYSDYNFQQNGCVCRNGLSLVNGQCQDRCPQ